MEPLYGLDNLLTSERCTVLNRSFTTCPVTVWIHPSITGLMTRLTCRLGTAACTHLPLCASHTHLCESSCNYYPYITATHSKVFHTIPRPFHAPSRLMWSSLPPLYTQVDMGTAILTVCAVPAVYVTIKLSYTAAGRGSDGRGRRDTVTFKVVVDVVHLRHLAGGRTRSYMGRIEAEKILQVVFPERPGALRRFLDVVSPAWNATLFHYRNSGNRESSVLLGVQVPSYDEERFQAALSSLRGAGEEGFAFKELQGAVREVFDQFIQ
ncbi:hypothetical protein VOLCADRAFT_88879 [Volvox carteri f. nagariensis]|uniref:ACT-like domain-containing protein n=1 Tax=Volvox carteri f. nagariensis TaxID=3068 RepID=D8TQ71_VOLCA|nr:uncharacterized protein VOLCADRAFT_88879 [Volvox carteri f. nagariensis]EFJ50484.1 hypothetical protein VOLCADRAFT_88879 [Volvox carteri f. nagariensis]|eukprot:XP_002948609.1 hypothetical protein VOLCADRAFT_88879 [Volvox carteri f. nagariensis]